MRWTAAGSAESAWTTRRRTSPSSTTQVTFDAAFTPGTVGSSLQGSPQQSFLLNICATGLATDALPPRHDAEKSCLLNPGEVSDADADAEPAAASFVVIQGDDAEETAVIEIGASSWRTPCACHSAPTSDLQDVLSFVQARGTRWRMRC